MNKKPSASSNLSNQEPTSLSLIEPLLSAPDLGGSLGNAKYILLPKEVALREQSAFPSGTREFYHFLRNEIDSIEVAVREEDYVEISMHDAWVDLATLFVAQHILLPVAINLLATYITRRLSARNVRSELRFLTKDGNEMSFKYQGPAQEFESVATKALEQFFAYDKEERSGDR